MGGGGDDKRMGWLEDVTNLMDVNLCKLQELLIDREASFAAFHGVVKICT